VRPGIRPQGVLWTLCLCGLSVVSSLNAQVSDGPLGLAWGMPKEAVERLGIRLCCRQVGTWGTRYTVARQDFNKMPRSFGDEEKIYLYFGNKNKLLRAYLAIPKDDGWNRYQQLNALVREVYPLVKACTRQTYSKYEALERGKSEETCKEYEAYSEYASNAIEVFVGLAKQPTEHVVSLIEFNRRLHTRK
jgi:hypothetical protein